MKKERETDQRRMTPLPDAQRVTKSRNESPNPALLDHEMTMLPPRPSRHRSRQALPDSGTRHTAISQEFRLQTGNLLLSWGQDNGSIMSPPWGVALRIDLPWEFYSRIAKRPQRELIQRSQSPLLLFRLCQSQGRLQPALQ